MISKQNEMLLDQIDADSQKAADLLDESRDVQQVSGVDNPLKFHIYGSSRNLANCCFKNTSSFVMKLTVSSVCLKVIIVYVLKAENLTRLSENKVVQKKIKLFTHLEEGIPTFFL